MDLKPLRSITFLDVHRRAMGGTIALLLMANLVVAVRHPEPRATTAAGAVLADGSSAPDQGTGPGGINGAPGKAGPPASTAVGTGPGALPANSRKLIGRYVPGKGTIPPGVTDDTITLVYYWKGDATMSSQFLQGQGTGQEGNVNEGEAFTKLIAYLNKHRDGGATFMGFPFDFHGRKIVGHVIEAGKSADTFAAANREITQRYKPFAAVSSHGSLSAYMCPDIARAGIHNFSTYDLGGLGGTLLQRTNGYCVPSGTSFEDQITLSVAYLAKQAATTQYQVAPGVFEKRVYGFLYAEYPGLVDVVPSIVARLRKAGLNIPKDAVVSMPADLTASQTVATNRVAKMRGAGVNTIVSPDAGAPLNFTHASQASGYNPDYFVWPCSGQDSTGMVRLYDPGQWARASGLTCYDPLFNSDLTNDDLARSTEWYKQYQEVAPGHEPPAPTPLVYQGLLPLVAGITNAGRDLTVEKFRAGMAGFKPYRYDAVKGSTIDPVNMLLSINHPGGSQVGDVAKVYWDHTKRTPGATTQGTYVYPEDRRYAPGAVF